MKFSRLLVIGVIVAMSMPMLAAVAKADGVTPGDPGFRTGGDPPDSEVPQGIITTNFTLSSATGDSPVTPSDPNSSPCGLTQGSLTTFSPDCFFQNDVASNQGLPETINALIFDLPGIAPSATVCGDIEGDPIIFGLCNVASDGGTGTRVTFTDGSIAYGQAFFLEVDGFTGGLTSAGYANVSEPSSLCLLGLGLVALVGLTRKRIFQRAV